MHLRHIDQRPDTRKSQCFIEKLTRILALLVVLCWHDKRDELAMFALARREQIVIEKPKTPCLCKGPKNLDDSTNYKSWVLIIIKRIMQFAGPPLDMRSKGPLDISHVLHVIVALLYVLFFT